MKRQSLFESVFYIT